MCCKNEGIKALPDQTIRQAVGNAITASKDWDGGRREREKPRLTKEDEFEIEKENAIED